MNPRTVRACRNVYKSDFILAHILNFLNLDEQVKLLEVSKRCEYVLKSFLWPKTCAHLTLYKTPYVNIVMTEVKSENAIDLEEICKEKTALSHKQCVQFLYLNAKNIRTLVVHSEYYYQQEVGVSFKNVQVFQNLNSLTYYRLVLNDRQMELLAQYCRKLERLCLCECYNEYMTSLVPGEHLNLVNIYAMKNLKELIIHCDPTKDSIMKSYNLQEIFLNLNLKCFILKHIAIEDNETLTDIKPLGSSLEILDIGIIARCFWFNFIDYLKHFKKLKELYINVSDCNTTFDAQLVDILVKNCSQLEKLSLEKCDLAVDDFSVLHKLQHLSLSSCGGLTFANFQQILGALKLRTFSMINTRMYGTINHIYVSPTLEMITIDTILFTQISEAFQKSLNNFENLHTLRWLNGDINDNWIIDKCPRLEYLHIPNPYLLRRIAFTKKSLKELTFTSCASLSWRFILIMMRNLTLKRLIVRTTETIDDHKDKPQNASGIRTTLELIIIPCGIFKMCLEFWLDLMCLNEQLHFLIYGKHEDLMDGIFLDELFCHEKFPARIKATSICGFKFDLLDLLSDFNRSLYLLNKYTSHYKYKNSNFTLEL